MYTSEKLGSDETGSGTETKPFKTVLKVKNVYDFDYVTNPNVCIYQALNHFGKGELCENFPTIYVDSKDEDKVIKNIASM